MSCLIPTPPTPQTQLKSMNLDPESAVSIGQEDNSHSQPPTPPAHHPPAPLDESFDVSTTIDPSYIISLIRALLPPNVSGVDACDGGTEGLKTDRLEERASSPYGNGTSSPPPFIKTACNDSGELRCLGGDRGSCLKHEESIALVGEQAWEECGCILWDLAASKEHAVFMVQNLLLEVLLENLMVSQSVRIKEISLGIIGNLACHEVPMKHIISAKGLLEMILDQLFVDDPPCLCEAFRLLSLGLQGDGRVTWAKALQSEQILSRLLWVSENTLNPQLLEKSLCLILAIIEIKLEVAPTLLATVMKLGLSDLLINLLSFEMSKLTKERMPERYAVLDLILHAVEALSTNDDFSKEMCSKKELFGMVSDLVRLPDKVEVANSCITAAVLISNILCESDDLASNMSHDMGFLQGLLDILPYASDDLEARSAIWSILAQLLVQFQECKITTSTLHPFVLAIAGKSKVIEEDLHNLDCCNEEQGSLAASRKIALERIMCMTHHSTASRKYPTKKEFAGDDHVDEENIRKLLDCCRRHIK